MPKGFFQPDEKFHALETADAQVPFQGHPGGHRHPGGGPAKLLDETGDDGDHLLFDRVPANCGDCRGGHGTELLQGWCRNQDPLGVSSKSDTAGQR